MIEHAEHEQRVVVTDLNIPFGSLTVFLIKLALASIPALLMVWFVMMVLLMLFMTMFGGIFGSHDLLRPGSPF